MSVASSQGTTVSFGSSSLGKVVSVSANFSSPQKEIRVLSANTDDATGQYLSLYEQTVCEQTVEIEALASDSLDSSIVGSKQTLSISGGGGWYVTFGTAICESFKITAKVGDVVRVNLSFKRSYA